MDAKKNGRVAYGIWEGVQPGLHALPQRAAVEAGLWGGRLPNDWEVADAETYAILAYLRKVVDESENPSEKKCSFYPIAKGWHRA